MALTTARLWVSVADALPTANYNLLVLGENGFWYSGQFDPASGEFRDDDNMRFTFKVTHWLEVVLPPGVRPG